MNDFSDEMNELESLIENNQYDLLINKLKDSFGIDIQGLEDDIDENSGKVLVKYTSDEEYELKYNYLSDSGFDLYSSEEVTLQQNGSIAGAIMAIVFVCLFMWYLFRGNFGG